VAELEQPDPVVSADYALGEQAAGWDVQ